MLKLVQENTAKNAISPILKDLEAENHHQYLLDRYYMSHKVQGHVVRTINAKKRIIEGWFQQYGVDGKPLYIWQAMKPISGRERMLEYARMLVESEISPRTIRHYLLTLNQFFSFVLENPYLEINEEFKRIQDIYGPIEKPISEFDLPIHVGDRERIPPMDPDKLYDFFSILRKEYVNEKRPVTARNYTMAVIAGECGFRQDELAHLNTYDLMFDSKKAQTTFAKGKKGTGKRSRITLFPPLARDTASYYLKKIRPQFENIRKTDILFPSVRGKILTSSSLSNAIKDFKKIAKKAGFNVMPHLTWHWFRRIFATRFIEQFPDKIHILRELLGHSSMSTIHCYICHSMAFMDKEIQSIVERIERCPLDGD